VAHTIRFRRPELPYVLSRMSVPLKADVTAQIRHLESLGYTIVDGPPPLESYGQPQSPRPRLPELGDAFSLRGSAE
jgi:hypothetical protein